MSLETPVAPELNDTGAAGRAGRRALSPGTRAFTLLLTAAMALSALANDSMLPAFAEIRAHHGLAPNANEVAPLITVFLFALGLGQLPAGLLADRFGRLPVLWGGIMLYIAGAVAAVFAPSLGWMLAARFLWGLGAAGPRVAVHAMVRDSYAGAAMARQMSTMMAVFLIVPMVAPVMGQAALAIGPWQGTIWLCVIAAAAVLVMSRWLPRTVPTTPQQALTLRSIGATWKLVLTTPGTLGYLISGFALAGALQAYVSTSENVIDEVFGMKRWFALAFAVVGLSMATANFLNVRLIGRIGLARMLRAVPVAQVVAASAMVLCVAPTGGRPPLWLFAPLLIAAVMTGQINMVNGQSAAMAPLGEVAGSAAAVLGSSQQMLGATLATLVGMQFDGTVTPLAAVYFGAAVVALVCMRWSRRVAAPITG